MSPWFSKQTWSSARGGNNYCGAVKVQHEVHKRVVSAYPTDESMAILHIHKEFLSELKTKQQPWLQPISRWSD